MQNAICIAAVLILSSAHVSEAGGFCERLDGLMNAALAPGKAVTFEIGGQGTQPVNCTHSREIGGDVSLHCARDYDYRSKDATIEFENLIGQVSQCAVALDPDDQTVSHPDSYDLRQFRMLPGTVSVSLKDKATLSQSFVFLRVSRPG